MNVVLCFLDPATIAMVNRSIEADGDESSWFDFPASRSQSHGRFGSQSPVRWSSERFGERNLADFEIGSFVASTPERETKRLV